MLPHDARKGIRQVSARAARGVERFTVSLQSVVDARQRRGHRGRQVRQRRPTAVAQEHREVGQGVFAKRARRVADRPLRGERAEGLRTFGRDAYVRVAGDPLLTSEVVCWGRSV